MMVPVGRPDGHEMCRARAIYGGDDLRHPTGTDGLLPACAGRALVNMLHGTPDLLINIPQ